MTAEQVGDLLCDAWKKGLIGNSVLDYIDEGILPVGIIREKLKLAIEGTGEEGVFEVREI